MPIGKDSIQNRVAKVAVIEDGEIKMVSETENTPAEVKPAPKKRAPAKAPAKKKPAAPKAEAPAEAVAEAAAEKPAEVVAEPAKEPATAVETAVMANVAPETVEAVVGHKENAKVEHVQVGQKMPHYLL